MSRILVAALALAAGAAVCSGPLRVSGPGLVVETEPAARPPDPEIAEVTASVPRGMGLAVTSDPAAPEAGDQAEPEDAETGPEPGNGGTPSGAQERVSPESERPPSPAPDPSVAAILVDELGAGRTEAGRWRDFVLAVMDRILGNGTGPEPAPPAEPEPVETEPEPEPEPLADTGDHLRTFIETDKGGDWSADVSGPARAKAARVFGLGFAGLAAARRDALTALCHYRQCETFTLVNAAVRAADFEAAAGEMFTRTASALGSDRAAVLAAWLRTGEYEYPAE